MSCAPGQPCEEGKKRRVALTVLVLMALIFLALSVASFVKSRNQVIPSEVHYGSYDAVEGKRIFQAYNCMGCHTLLGNGAYFGPDLTNIYKHAGPAWLSAFLPSAGGWPTGPALQVHLQKPEQIADSGTSDLNEYLKRFPGAAERIERRGGHPTFMPNLPIKGDEVGKLIAFLKYTSEMNTEGWPPKPQIDALQTKWAKPFPAAATAAPSGASAAATAAPAAAADPAELGAKLVKDYGCTACHAVDQTKLVGPGWGDLYGAKVQLTDGSSVTADAAYLAESIHTPDAKVVAGFAPGVMPAYASQLNDEQIDAIVAYIRTLSGGAK